MRILRCCSTSSTGTGNDVAAASLQQGDSEWKLRAAAAPELVRGGSSGSLLLRLQTIQHRGVLDAKQMIFPRGFPDSVAPGYAGYTGWLAAGLFAHSFTVMVSTNALLSGFFMEMSAASWLMKDLLPPLLAGTLASRIHTLEANPKKWLGAACFANSLLGGAEFLIPHLLPKESWMAIAICTNVGKMTGYLVIGASRAVLQKTLATGDNLGETTAKLGMLGMLMHCFGSVTALTLTQYLDFWGQFAAISAGAVVGFYAPVRASSCVVMSSVTVVSLRRVASRWSDAREAAAPWTCPTPSHLHDELAARWTVRHSLASRTNAWRELLLGDPGVLRSGRVALHVGPALASADDVAAVAGWRDGVRAAGVGVPDAWTLGAAGDGRLLLLYSKSATSADVIEGFAVAWLATRELEAELCGERAAASAGLAAASAASLDEWRCAAAEMRESMEAAGWECERCSADDVAHRVEWLNDATAPR